MSHAYTEDQLVEQPAIGLFAALGWQTISTKLGDSPHVFKIVSDYLITRKTRGLSPRFWSMRNGIASSG